MARIIVDAKGFNASFTYVNGITYENISRLDIFCSILLIGAAGPLDFLYYGWRCLPIRLCDGLKIPGFVESRRGLLCKSQAFDELIQSEKATITYWLGMAFTKLIAGRRLRVPWLCHVERLIDQGVLIPISGTYQRADLAGPDINKSWHVFESKGRSCNINEETIRYAKSQASRNILINGSPPSTASASITRLFTKPISIELIDPQQNDWDRVNSWEINENKFYRVYYEPIINHLNDNKAKSVNILGIDFDIAEAEALGMGIWVGLIKDIRKNPSLAPKIVTRLYEILNKQNYNDVSNILNGNVSIGYDGLMLGSHLYIPE